MSSLEGRKFVAVQVALAVLVAGSLGFMFVSTGVYEEVRDGTVRVLCMSCIKLEYDKSSGMNYTFDTADGGPHPDFVLENLKDGPVFLHYGQSDCPSCDEMLPPLQDFFEADFEKEELYSKKFDFGGREITYVHIFVSNRDIPNRIRESWKTYDKRDIRGFPMFTLITRRYRNMGETAPSYGTIYGAFGTTYREREALLENILSESVELYERNAP